MTVAREYLRAEIIIEFTENQRETILERVEKIGIHEWEYYYNEGNSGNYLTWDMGMEFEDGTIISKHGDFSDNGEPGNLDDFFRYYRTQEETTKKYLPKTYPYFEEMIKGLKNEMK